jgi:hypothetical protein
MQCVPSSRKTYPCQKKVKSGTQDTDSDSTVTVEWAGNDDKMEVRVKQTSRSNRHFYLAFRRFQVRISVHRTVIKIDITCEILWSLQALPNRHTQINLLENCRYRSGVSITKHVSVSQTVVGFIRWFKPLALTTCPFTVCVPGISEVM